MSRKPVTRIHGVIEFDDSRAPERIGQLSTTPTGLAQIKTSVVETLAIGDLSGGVSPHSSSHQLGGSDTILHPQVLPSTVTIPSGQNAIIPFSVKLEGAVNCVLEGTSKLLIVG